MEVEGRNPEETPDVNDKTKKETEEELGGITEEKRRRQARVSRILNHTIVALLSITIILVFYYAFRPGPPNELDEIIASTQRTNLIDSVRIAVLDSMTWAMQTALNEREQAVREDMNSQMEDVISKRVTEGVADYIRKQNRSGGARTGVGGSQVAKKAPAQKSGPAAARQKTTISKEDSISLALLKEAQKTNDLLKKITEEKAGSPSSPDSEEFVMPPKKRSPFSKWGNFWNR